MPIAWAAAIGAVGSIAGSAIQSGGQQQAANTQQSMFNTITGQETPFLQGGYEAEKSLTQLLGGAPATGPGGTASGTNLPGGYLTQTFNPTQSQLDNYPGYQYQKQAGQLATESASTPGSGAISGAGLKSLTSFNQGLAASNYGNYFNQFQTQQNNIFNRLSGIAGLGQNAAGNLGNAGTQLGTGIAQAQAGAAGSIGAGVVGAANSASSGMGLNYLLANGYGGAGSGGSALSGNMSNAAGYTDSSGVMLPQYCDYALKCEIEPYRFNGTSGLIVHEFEYKTDQGKKHLGYIAQEVQKKYPEAISIGPKGFLMVDYAKIPGWDELDRIMKEF